MPLVYRTVVAVPRDHDVVSSVSSVLSEWLSRRGTAGARVDFTRSGSYELSKRSRALVVRHDNPEERVAFLRLTTESDKPDGIWRTTVTAVSDPERLPHRYVWIDMTADPSGILTDVDRLDIAPPDAVRMLLDEVPGFDGTHPLPPEPVIVRGKDEALVNGLIDAIRDPGRHLAIVVSGTPPDLTVAAWREAMASVLSRSTGMCAGYVLDAAAQERVDRRLPRGFDVPAGGVRTFLPRVDLVDDADARRHPRMGAPTLDAAREGARIRNWVGLALARSVRGNAVESPLPPALKDVDSLLTEEELDLFVEEESDLSTPPRPTPVSASADSSPVRMLEQLRERLSAQVREAQRLRDEAKRLSTRLTDLAEEREQLLAETADLAEELDDTREALHTAQHENAWLRGRLHGEGLYRLAAEQAPPNTDRRPPRKVEDLLDRITGSAGLPHLFFTIDDHDTVRELTGSRKEHLWVTRAWEALLALNDYARYQFDNPGSGLSIHAYLREPPSGYHAIPVRRYAAGESDHVRNRDKLSDKRVFRVPVEVDPRGEVAMYEHIKLDTEYGICPRLYFYSHLGPQTTNRVYIGYLGRHLPIQSTN